MNSVPVVTSNAAFSVLTEMIAVCILLKNVIFALQGSTISLAACFSDLPLSLRIVNGRENVFRERSGGEFKE